jgi:hypothetical protein
MRAPVAIALAVAASVAVAQSAQDREHWASDVAPLLKTPIWNKDQAADATAVLIVPIHAAFALGEESWQRQLGDAFAAALRNRRDIATGRLHRLQFLWMAARFVAVATEAKKPDRIPAGLPDFLESEFERFWAREPAWQWGSPELPGIKARIRYKLDRAPRTPSYYGVILDEDQYVLALASDLRGYRRATGIATPRQAMLDEAYDLAREVYRARGEFQADGGWLFDKGYWTDFPDFAHAGRDRPETGPPKKVPGIAADSSHSHKFPAWLTSHIFGSEPGSRARERFQEMIRGLERQLFTHVIKPPSPDFPGYRATNFMDGRNGLYRWDIASEGFAGTGYGPYELSGTLTLGWWALIGSERTRALYEGILATFPLEPAVIRAYLGPIRPGGKDPAVELPESYRRLRPLLCSLAAKLPRRAP